jgi:hypothetical protein
MPALVALPIPKKNWFPPSQKGCRENIAPYDATREMHGRTAFCGSLKASAACHLQAARSPFWHFTPKTP